MPSRIHLNETEDLPLFSLFSVSRPQDIAICRAYILGHAAIDGSLRVLQWSARVSFISAAIPRADVTAVPNNDQTCQDHQDCRHYVDRHLNPLACLIYSLADDKMIQ